MNEKTSIYTRWLIVLRSDDIAIRRKAIVTFNELGVAPMKYLPLSVEERAQLLADRMCDPDAMDPQPLPAAVAVLNAERAAKIVEEVWPKRLSIWPRGNGIDEQLRRTISEYVAAAYPKLAVHDCAGLVRSSIQRLVREASVDKDPDPHR